MTVCTIDYAPRPQQREFHAARARFRVLAAHRRMGKTVAVINDVIRDTLKATSFMPCGAYVAPLRNQASRVAWPLFQHFTKDIPGVTYNKAELLVNLPGQRRVFALGSDNPDAIRGIGLDACVIDETAQIDPYAWSQVIRPALADRKGRCTFIGTPKGRLNLFHELWEKSANLDGWWRGMFRASETGIIDADELRRLKREMNEAEYAQEMECSFNAAIVGSYYAREMADADAEGRITTVRHDKRYPVLVALDLGWSDLTVAWHCQPVGNEIRVLKCQAWHHTSLADVIGEIAREPWEVNQLLCPHDIKQTELGTGTSRLELLWSLGVNAMVAPQLRVDDGIEAVRDILPRCVFDREGCGDGIEALIQYRTEYDNVTRVYSRKPLHNWASHYADSFRYLAISLPYADTGVLGASPRRRRRDVNRGII